jgi:hypothetical protein
MIGNKFYAYKISDNVFLRVGYGANGKIVFKKTAADNCSYWKTKKLAATWRVMIKVKFPNAGLVELKLCEK